MSAAGTRSAGFPTIAWIWTGRTPATATWKEALPVFRSFAVVYDVWTLPKDLCDSATAWTNRSLQSQVRIPA